MRQILFLAGLLLLTACATTTSTPITASSSQPYGTCTPDWVTPSTTKETKATKSPTLTEKTDQSTGKSPNGYTHIQPDGNRLVSGHGQIPDLKPLNIQLPGTPSWLVAVPSETGSFWTVVLENGQVLGFQVDSQGWQPAPIRPGSLVAGQPPLLFGNGNSPSLLVPTSNQASSLTHPIPVFGSNLSQIFIEANGDLIGTGINAEPELQLKINALPDARILNDSTNRLLLLTDPTTSYDHGVLGDALEASSFTLIHDLQQGGYTTVPMAEKLIIEGIAPIWADLDADGQREIIVTVSNAEQGAQIVIFSETGEQIAAGPAVGQGYRWRHQIAVAPFGPGGEMELVDVLTPHLGGVVEFYRWQGDELKVVAQLTGYTSHVIGTRNLDMAAAGDFDNDGRLELILPRQDRLELGAIRHTEEGADIVWTLPLDGRLVSNIAALTLADGNLALGVGLENDILTIWHP